MKTGTKCTAKGTSAGQAMTEMLIVAGVFTGFITLGLAALGNLGSAHSNLLMQSRYAAWERTVWLSGSPAPFGSPVTKTDAAIRDELLQRVIGQSPAPFTSVDSSNPQLPATLVSTLTDPLGQPLVNSANDVTMSTAFRRMGTPTDDIAIAMSALSYLNAGLSLPTDTSVTATSTWTLGAQSAVLKRFLPGWAGITASDHTVIASNTWTAQGRDGTLAEISAAIPATTPAGDIGLAVQALFPLSFDVIGLQVGKVAPDVVPPNRVNTPESTQLIELIPGIL